MVLVLQSSAVTMFITPSSFEECALCYAVYSSIRVIPGINKSYFPTVDEMDGHCNGGSVLFVT